MNSVYLPLSIAAAAVVVFIYLMNRVSLPIKQGKPDAYWVGTSLVRDYDGKVLAQIVVRQGMMWGYHTGVTESDVVFGYVSEQYAKRAAENKCKVNVIQKKEGF